MAKKKLSNNGKTALKVTVAILATGLLVGGLGALTRGFTNWEPSTWLDQWRAEEDDSGEDLNVEGEGINLLVRGGPRFATKASVGDYKKVIATLNADAMDQRIRWTSSDETKISFSNSVTQSGTGTEMQLKKLFAGEVTVSASAYLQPEIKAEFKVTYDNAVQSLEFVGIAGATTSNSITDLQSIKSTLEETESKNSLFDWAAGDRAETLTLESTSGENYGVTVSAQSFGTEHHFYYINSEEPTPTIALFGDNPDSNAYGYCVFYGHGAEGAEALDPVFDGIVTNPMYVIGSTDEYIEKDMFVSYVSGNDVIVLLPFNETYMPTAGENGNLNLQCDDAYTKVYTAPYAKATSINTEVDMKIDPETVTF